MRIANVVLNDFTRDNRVLKISSTLADAGYEVTVVALHKDNLPENEEHPRGFMVRRISLQMPTWLFRGALKLPELAFRIAFGYRRFDAWHCNDAEAFAIGLLAKGIRPRLKLIYDCHEFEGERNGKSIAYLKGIRWLERRFIRFAEEVIVVSPSIARAYQKRYQMFDLPPVSLVRNVPHRLEPMRSKGNPQEGELRESLGLMPQDFIALYQGAFTMNRGIEELLAMSSHLKGSRIHLVFMGYGMHEDLIRAEAEFNENVHFQSAVPYSEVLSYTCGADVGLVSVRPICLSYLYCLPNKLFECIQAGVPVLVNELPDCVSLLEHYGIGKVVKGNTPEHWLEALRQMERENPSLKAKVKEGLIRAQSELNWEKEQSSLTAIYGRLRLVHA
jgi:glycosyltransferase involved in cell wall biosynthesis